MGLEGLSPIPASEIQRLVDSVNRTGKCDEEPDTIHFHMDDEEEIHSGGEILSSSDSPQNAVSEESPEDQVERMQEAVPFAPPLMHAEEHSVLVAPGLGDRAHGGAPLAADLPEVSGTVGSTPNADYVFASGEKVGYWSETHGQWMDAVVIRIKSEGHNGTPPTYDLDVKRGASAAKMQRRKMHIQPQAVPDPGTPTVALGAPAAPQPEAAARRPDSVVASNSLEVSAAIAVNAPSASVETPAVLPSQVVRFDVGEHVEYWSDTYQQFMQSVVVRLRDEETYDLDVKRGAHIRNMRKLSDAPPAVAAESQLLPASVAGDAPIVRGPSPLSGRLAGGADREERLYSQQRDTLVRQVGANGFGQGAQSAYPNESSLLQNGREEIATSGMPGPAAGRNSLHDRPERPTFFGSSLSYQNSLAQQKADALPIEHSSSSNTSRLAEPPVPSGLLAQALPTAGVGAAYSASGGGSTPHAGASGAGHRPYGNGVVTGHVVAPKNVDAAHKGPAVTGVSVNGTRVAAMPGPRMSAAAGLQTNAPRSTSPIVPGSSGSKCVEMGDLQLGSMPFFDPAAPAQLSQLTTQLGLGKNTKAEKLGGFTGGLNEGVWVLKDAGLGNLVSRFNGDDLVLKLVKCQRIAPSIPTEAENFSKIQSEFPGVASDPSLAFPVKLFSCLGNGGQKRYDLIVMRKVKGTSLAEVIANKWYGNQVPELMQILDRLGFTVAEFHARYCNWQHGDLQPSNVFFRRGEG
eukprot:gnl/TRDRNA2_/TRDRNA2_86237_c0_seq1.p1 gnl/TRDRNA2_/TRDRNA2_86237_c0~~gnl/TRDRNA2_/TRDRNA2_86237_c0_seq1.p1  ORF type:complete len:743 (-),score=104.90 gnl/TRDRNA2_/TRDRNA2_86237_c0_seq1:379-2607(-)